MSIMRDGRDTAASLFYLKCLDGLREEHLQRAARGESIPADFLAQGEVKALERTKRECFTRLQRALFLPPDKVGTLTDDQDFEARSTRLVEMGMLESHRALTKIPWAGHPEYRDFSGGGTR
jgi:hypothetical protein